MTARETARDLMRAKAVGFFAARPQIEPRRIDDEDVVAVLLTGVDKPAIQADRFDGESSGFPPAQMDDESDL